MIGFTGTQAGMTVAQWGWVSNFMGMINGAEVWAAHGDCVGADHDFHRIVRQLGPEAHPVGRVHLFPPVNPTKRAFCDYDLVEPEGEYLDRNHHIVDRSKIMLATPGEDYEVIRSGTWATIRYAHKVGQTVWVVNPDGSVNPDWSAVKHG